MGTLILVDVADGALASSAGELLGAAQALGGDVAALLIGSGVRGLAGQLPVGRVFVADDARLADFLAERYLPLVAAAVEQAKPEVVLLPHTLNWRELAPR